MWRFGFRWGLWIRRELESCAKKVVYIFVISPASGNGAKNVDATVDELETVSKYKSQFNISLKRGLGILRVIQGLGTLDYAGGICCQCFVFTEGDGFEVNPFFASLGGGELNIHC